MRIDSEPTVLDRLSALADLTRSRLLLVLDAHELTVGELCQVLQLPQSTVSRHLKVLGDEGWVVSRADGPSRQYTMDPALDAGARELWSVVKGQVRDSITTAQDQARLDTVLAARRARSQEFFSSSASQWDALRDELFGRQLPLAALLGLLDDQLTVADLGCGTGLISGHLARHVKRVVAVDSSRAMITAARQRLVDVANVELREGDLEALPIEDGTVDAAVVMLVLHYVVEPARALAEAARILRPGGRLLVVDMTPHAREDYRARMGHLWQGFAESELAGWLGQAGFAGVRYTPLPTDPDARGPQLFTATARRADT